MIGRVMPYVGAVIVAVALVAGGVVIANSVEAATVVLPGFPDDPTLAWDIQVDDAEWAVGDENNIYVAAPGRSSDLTAITVWNRASGELVRHFSAVRPTGDFMTYHTSVDEVMVTEYCSESADSWTCELVASDATSGDTLWQRDTSDTGVGIVGRFVVLSTGSRLGLFDLHSGDEQASMSGDHVYYEATRPEVTVRTGQDLAMFRLPNVDSPIVVAELPSDGSVYDVVADEVVVGDARSLRVTQGGALVTIRSFPSNIEGVWAASDELALVITADGWTWAVSIHGPGSGKMIWTSDADSVYSWVGPSGSAIFSSDGSEVVSLLDQATGDTIVQSPGGWVMADGGVVLVEPERVWGFGYDEQDEVWSVDGLTADSTFHLVDDGFVTIETDGTVRLYQ